MRDADPCVAVDDPDLMLLSLRPTSSVLSSFGSRRRSPGGFVAPNSTSIPRPNTHNVIARARRLVRLLAIACCPPRQEHTDHIRTDGEPESEPEPEPEPTGAWPRAPAYLEASVA